VNQRAFGLLLIAVGAALSIGAFAHYKMVDDDRQRDRDVSELACMLADGGFRCDQDPISYTMNWVVAGVGAVLFSTGVLVAATGGTRTVRLEGQQPAGTAPPPRNESLAAALAELDALRESGLVSDDEYAAKRTEILGRL
jgi:Short C-terminal domain